MWGARVMYVFDILSGRVFSAHLVAGVALRVPKYPTRRSEFLQIEPLNAAMLNLVRGLTDLTV
jgi:hypothetical protein